MKEGIIKILNFINKAPNVTIEEKQLILVAIQKADNDLVFSEYDSTRFGRISKITTLLLEKALEELEDKNKLVKDYAREAQTAVALERIRAQALAMQTSKDLLKVANVLREQMGRLGQPELESSIVHIYNDNAEIFEAWYSFRPPNNATGELITGLAKIPKNSSLWAREVIAKYNSAETEYTIVSSGQKLLEWYKVLELACPETIDYDEEGNIIVPEILYYHFSKFSGGSLLMILNEEPSAEAEELQKRAALEFELAYTRFLDLQKAEAQTHKALIEIALERVRARALAMQEPEELVEVAQVLRLEMGCLGVKELEDCSIFIQKENTGDVEGWYVIKDKRQTAERMMEDYFPLILNDTWVGREMLKIFNSDNQTGIIPIPGDHCQEWVQHYGSVFPPFLEGLYGNENSNCIYHLAKFPGGAIGVTWPVNLSEENWELLNRAATVFSLAFSRFKDLTQTRSDLIRLKEEKQRTEKALAELKATQSQLIQAAKMASLGELTAGIAHEIQNPLNFVNNFSEVSTELVEELEQEVAKEHLEEVLTLAADLKQNLKKIHHHGQRADAIVKNMLQHSRVTTNEKQLTNLNALADEYLRLAFHGFRVKEKDFICTIDIQYDNNLDKVAVVPQELGRVLLNLYNNAFYATQQKKSQLRERYQPEVRISTICQDEKIIIKVRDNGTGIPDKIKNKIFQPFFTTKPTGQGTGLGLSLSYDIITKGHGGGLQVESAEGEYTEMTFWLPL